MEGLVSMWPLDKDQRRSVVATTCTGLALAVCFAACGDEEPAGKSPVAVKDEGEPLGTLLDPPVTSGGDRVYATEVVRDVQEGFMLNSPGSVCSELSDAAQRRLVGAAGRRPRTCEEAVTAALKRWRAAGEEPIVSKVMGIEIEGDEAFVTLDVPELGRRRVRVVKDDSWDLPVLRLDHPPGFQLLPDVDPLAEAGDDTYTGVHLPPRLKGSRRTGERAAAAEVVLDVQEGFVIKSGQSVCVELTRAAEARAAGARRSCAAAVEAATDRWHAAGEDPVVSKVRRVTINGSEAAVTVDHPDGGSYEVRVVKGRNWKLPALDLANRPGLVPDEVN
jgi:hypothetical protein